MEHKRIIKGNYTIYPTGAELLKAYETNAVVEKALPGRGNLPLSSIECVVDSREFSIEKKC